MDELYEARLALELHAAALTVGKVGEEDLRRFRALRDATIRPVRGKKMVDPTEYIQANRAFHEFQVDLARNSTISELYRRLCVFELQERAITVLGLSAAGGSSEEHRAIVAAYERGDLEAAQAALRANLETGRQISRSAIEQAGGVI
jgi:DNA-binding GntR family transcriptional regulator